MIVNVNEVSANKLKFPFKKKKNNRNNYGRYNRWVSCWIRVWTRRMKRTVRGVPEQST